MIKFDKLMCPHVGCYFAAKCDSNLDDSIAEARAAVQRHRHVQHSGAKSLVASVANPKWMHEAD